MPATVSVGSSRKTESRPSIFPSGVPAVAPESSTTLYTLRCDRQLGACSASCASQYSAASPVPATAHCFPGFDLHASAW